MRIKACASQVPPIPLSCFLPQNRFQGKLLVSCDLRDELLFGRGVGESGWDVAPWNSCLASTEGQPGILDLTAQAPIFMYFINSVSVYWFTAEPGPKLLHNLYL